MWYEILTQNEFADYFINSDPLHTFLLFFRRKSTHLSTKIMCAFFTKSAFVGINPLPWMKSLCDEICLTAGYGGGFHFI